MENMFNKFIFHYYEYDVNLYNMQKQFSSYCGFLVITLYYSLVQRYQHGKNINNTIFVGLEVVKIESTPCKFYSELVYFFITLITTH
jgi:hypothetical protein